MMIIKTITKTSLILLCLGGVFSCTSEGDGESAENAILLTAAELSNTASFVLDKLPSSVAVTAKSTLLLNQDVTVNIESAPNLVKTYNEENNTNYLAFPEKTYTFSKTSAVIKSGSNVSESIKIELISKEGIDDAKKYMLPVTIKGVNSSNGIAVLEASKTTYYILKSTIIRPVFVISGKIIGVTLAKPIENVRAWSFEFLFKVDEFKRNRAVLFFTNEIYSFFASPGTEKKWFYTSTMGGVHGSKIEFSKNTWYHIAVVYDGTSIKTYVNGVLDTNSPAEKPGKIFKIEGMGFGNIINTKGQIAELRFWSKAISQTQIMNNRYITDSKSEGLELYFKLDEGKGGVFTDATGHGHTAQAEKGTNKWIQDVRFSN